MWIVIFAFELLFVIYQLLHAYKNLPIVEHTIGYWFLLVNCCQLGWVISYSFDVIWLASLVMILNIGFLTVLNSALYNRDYIDAPIKEGTNPEDRAVVPEQLKDMNIVMEYITFRMPFQMHLGWAVFILVVNINEICAQYELTVQGIVALVSIVALWIFGICVLFIPRYPLFIVPVMIAWGAVSE